MRSRCVQVTVRAAVGDGLIVTFLKYFHGVIDKYHLPHNQLATWRTAFAPGMRLKARIIHISTSSKMVRLTLLKNLLEYHLPTVLPTLGAVYDDVTVIRPDYNLGALVKVPLNPSPQLGFIHISNFEPKQGAKTVNASVGKEYPAGTALRAKVNGFRYASSCLVCRWQLVRSRILLGAAESVPMCMHCNRLPTRDRIQP